MADGAPKSAVELAMEKLRRQDAASGAADAALALTPDQVARIAEARRLCEARTAEARILHQSALAGPIEADARAELEANHRRDLARLATDRDRAIARIREGGAS